MNARVSKISLIVFCVLFLLSTMLMSTAGDYWPWYTLMSVFAVVPLTVGPRRYRLAGAIALILSGCLIAADIIGGRHLHAQHPEIRQ